MAGYHFHHPEKMFTGRAELLEIITGQRLMTLAMISDGEPYLVTMNYGFDPEARCFYFHGAGAGRKLAAMRADGRVCGQVIEDRGYIDGKCDHAYRSVHFWGQVRLLVEEAEKREALTLMIRQMERDPEPVIARLLGHGRLTKTTVGRIEVLGMTGKRNALDLLPTAVSESG